MPPYRLQVLLGLREEAEKAAKDAYASAQKAMREQEALLKKEEKMLEDMIADRLRRREEYAQKLASGEMKITDQSQVTRFIERLKEKEADQKNRIEAQKEQVRLAEKEVKKALDHLVKATQDLKALQKHKENWAAEVKKERMMKEEDAQDEIGQSIFNKKAKEAAKAELARKAPTSRPKRDD